MNVYWLFRVIGAAEGSAEYVGTALAKKRCVSAKTCAETMRQRCGYR